MNKDTQARLAWRARNKDKVRGYLRKYLYGPLPRPEPKNCECCGRVPPKGMQVDHDHVTGKFRGWLCGPCNRALGLLGDNIEGVLKLLSYLTS